MPALADAYLAGGARFLQIRSKHAPSGRVSRHVRGCRGAGAQSGRDRHRERSRRHREAVARPTACTWGRTISIPHRSAAFLAGRPSSACRRIRRIRCARRRRWRSTTLRWARSSATSTKDTGYRDVGTAFVQRGGGDSSSVPATIETDRGDRRDHARAGARRDSSRARRRWRSFPICSRQGIPKRACASIFARCHADATITQRDK